MQLPFGQSAYSRANGLVPSVRLVNLYPEAAPTAKTGVVLLPRPGLTAEDTFEAGLRGLYLQDGVFGGALLAVAGTELFNAGVLVGTVDGTDRTEWAYTVDGLFVLGGGTVYQTDGTTVTATAFPDSAPVASIAAIDNFLVAVREDTGTLYFRVPGDTTWNALDFFSAEAEPDKAICVRTLAGLLYVFGSSSIEAYNLTGSAEEPFSRVEGLGANRGIKDRDSAVNIDNTIIWVGEDSIVYRMAGTPLAISDSSITAQVEASGTCSSWTFTRAGHPIYSLKLDAETIAFDVSTGSWITFDWEVDLGIYTGSTAYAAVGDTVATLSDRADDYTGPMAQIFTAIAATDKAGTCDCIEVSLSPGRTDIGLEAALLQMRWSDDQGRTWTDWKDGSTGASGQYRHRTRWRRLGMIDAPGRIFEFRKTDATSLRFSGVQMNPPNGGRSRG